MPSSSSGGGVFNVTTGGGWTLELWANIPSLSAVQYARLFTSSDTAQGGSASNAVSLYLNSNGALSMETRHGDGTYGTATSAAGLLSSNTWTQCVRPWPAPFNARCVRRKRLA